MSEEEIIKQCIYESCTNLKEINKLISYLENLQQENTQLKERVDMYENPEDLTLMFMYCTEEAKDKIKHLKSVLKEIREYIITTTTRNIELNCTGLLAENQTKKLLEIIDKGIGEDK